MKILIPLLFTVTLLHAQSRKDYALFFPVAAYSDGWPQLSNTLTECEDLASDLSTLFGFETVIHLNKTKPEIKTKLAELAGNLYSPDDQLLLFFSMHGYFDEAGEAGCLCPAGAKINDPAFDTWLLHTELRTLVTRIPCEHILIIIDACYSGTFGGKKGKPDGPDYQKETTDCQANIQQALIRKTRYYIAAGGKERTPAISDLVNKIRSAFGGRHSGEDGILSLKELLAVISEANPTPKDGEFTGDLGGGFVFVPKGGCGPQSDRDGDNVPDGDDKCPDEWGSQSNGCPKEIKTSNDARDLAAWRIAKNQNTVTAYHEYLQQFPKGEFINIARQAIQSLDLNASRQREESVWNLAREANTIEGYDKYLIEYPNGKHINIALEFKTWKGAERINTESALRDYLRKYPQGTYKELANQMLRQIEDKTIQHRQEIAWEIANEKNTVDGYKKYLLDYPNGLHESEAITRLRNFEKDETPPVADDGLVFVKGGIFTMGCTNEQQDCPEDEKPAHPVTVEDFYIGAYEVTQRFWNQVMGVNPSSFNNCNDCPVEQVSWNDVQEFIQKLNKQTDRYYRLPTEAEWEYAARGGGNAVLFGNGKNIADPKSINFAGDWASTSYSIKGLYRGKTVPVGSLRSPNALGLHDMSGNVWEWCSDWFGQYFNVSQINPIGPASGTLRTLRGGSWYNAPLYCRVTNRLSLEPNNRSNYVGFRLARTD